MNGKFEYSVAIRTLGRAGEDFEKEIHSLMSQTIRPQKILVYIARGYPKPRQIAGEEYIYVDKGMVAQRALSYSEVETEYLLLLDDDVFIPCRGVETLAEEMVKLQGDCIAADVFSPHLATVKSKVYDFLVNLSYPRRDDEWAFKVMRNASFSYNNNPKRGVYLSQSAAGPISLWKKSTLEAIHYQDERWLDDMGFAFGDDQLMFQKVFKNGHRLLISYDSGAVHLNAQSSSAQYQQSVDKFYKRAKALYMVWYRSCFQLDSIRNRDKLIIACSYLLKQLHLLFIHIVYAVMFRKASVVLNFIRGNVDGYQEAKNKLKSLPNFIVE